MAPKTKVRYGQQTIPLNPFKNVTFMDDKVIFGSIIKQPSNEVPLRNEISKTENKAHPATSQV